MPPTDAAQAFGIPLRLVLAAPGKPAAEATATRTATATPSPTPTPTPNPYAGDTLTDLSKVPNAPFINWPAYVPPPSATALPGVKGTGVFIWPVHGFISTPFGTQHLAIDIAGPAGTNVLAADSGTVVFAGVDYGGLGNAVEIDHGDGYVTAYGHNEQVAVKVGDVVSQGQVIALRGSTGHSTGPHVHFAIHKDGKPVDPLSLLVNSAPPAPPPVQLPSLAGLTESKVLALLKGYPIHLVIDPATASTTVPVGILDDQQPAAATPVDAAATVHLAFSAGTPTPTVSPTPTATPGVTVTAGPAPTGGTRTPPAGPTATTGAPTTPTPANPPVIEPHGTSATAVPSPTPLASPSATATVAPSTATALPTTPAATAASTATMPPRPSVSPGPT